MEEQCEITLPDASLVYCGIVSDKTLVRQCDLTLHTCSIDNCIEYVIK